MKRLIYVACSAALVSVSYMASAQERQIRLQCDGYADYFVNNLKDIPISGLYLEIINTGVKIAGSMGFDGDWKIIKEDAAIFSFSQPNNTTYFGSLNRYSGTLHLSNVVQDKAKVVLIANCKPANKLF